MNLRVKGGARLANLAGLILGFGVGQGSLFVAQTWLLTSGRIGFLADFSFIFTFLILAYQAIDFGGLVILARRSLIEETDYNLGTFFWSFSAVRLIIALLLLCGAIGWWFLQPADFASNYAASACLGLIALSLNPGGLLDGAGRSGWNGATWALPFIASTIALPFSVSMPQAHAGLLLGTALSAGGVAATAVQFMLLTRMELHPGSARPSLAAMLAGWREGALYTLGWIPGQLYFRGQVAITMTLLGPTPTALLIYAKQLIMIVTRILYFSRRVEFRRLVERLSDEKDFVHTVISVQRYSLMLSVLGAAAIVVISLLMKLYFPNKTHGAEIVAIYFSIVIVTSAIYATFTQACYASKRTKLAMCVSILVVILGLLLQAMLGRAIGMAGIAFAEAFSQLFGAMVLIALLKKQHGEQATSPRRMLPVKMRGLWKNRC